MKKAWSIWCKTIGSRISDNDQESDIAAIIRTLWVLLHAITCVCIISNFWFIHSWRFWS